MSSRRRFIKRSSAALLATGLPGISRLLSAVEPHFDYTSAFIKLKLAVESPRLLYFSTDSLGQGQWKGSPLLNGNTASQVPYTSSIKGNRISYFTGGEKRPAWEITCNEKEILLRTRHNENGQIVPFEWLFSQKLNHCTVLGGMENDMQLKFPCVLHLPAMGSFRVSCNRPDVTLFYDAYRFAEGREKGEPFIRLAFAGAQADEPDITYRLESVAIYPALPKIKQDPRFDGFRKNFINIFQMNPRIKALANNSASDACAFTVYQYAEMARHTPELAEGLNAMDLVKQTLDQYLQGMKAYGQVGYKGGSGWLSQHDSLDSWPSLIISACYYSLHSKDTEWARRHYTGIRAWAEKMMATDKNKDGFIEYGYTGNAGSWQERPLRRPANWWDTIGFGHDDAYSNALAYRAYVLLSQMAGQLHKAEDSSYFAAIAAKLKGDYYARFFNPATGVLGGWRSADGQLHDYYFTFVNGIAVCYDLLEPAQAKQVLQALLAKMKEVGYTNFKLGLPGNLIPVADEDYAHKNHRSGYQRFQVYENGGATACYAYFTIHALFKTGMRKEAEALLFPMLESFKQGEFEGHCPGSNMTKDWKTWNGECWGYEGFLVDNYLTLLAVMDY